MKPLLQWLIRRELRRRRSYYFSHLDSHFLRGNSGHFALYGPYGWWGSYKKGWPPTSLPPVSWWAYWVWLLCGEHAYSTFSWIFGQTCPHCRRRPLRTLALGGSSCSRCGKPPWISPERWQSEMVPYLAAQHAKWAAQQAGWAAEWAAQQLRRTDNKP